MNAHLRKAALLCLALHFQVVLGQTSSSLATSSVMSLSPTELKQVYLACDQAANTTRLAASDAVRCSIVSEELKHRVFGGDLEQLLDWWRAHRQEPNGRMSTSEALAD